MSAGSGTHPFAPESSGPGRLPVESERRILSHLSIPRNVDDLAQMLRTDAGFQNNVNGGDVHKALEAFESLGWVVNLGEHDDHAKLAASVERSEARTMPDEKAEIYSRRMTRPDFAWRAAGDQYMYTDAGRDASRESTQLLVPPPMTTSQLQAAIDAEWARVHRDAPFSGSIADETGGSLPDDWSGSLAGHLLEEEFRAWLAAVLAEHKAVWGEGEARSLRLPMSGGSQYSDAYEIIVVDAENQKSSITAAAPWFMALVETTAVTDADTGSTLDEPEYTGYARKSVAAADMNAGSGTSGSVTNANAIVFAACTSGTDTVIGFAHCVASTVGVMRKYGTCSSTVISTTQTPAQFAAGAYTTTVA